MLIAVAGVLLGSLGLSDAQSIARFKEFQRQPGVQNHRVEFVAGGNVATALHEFVLCIYRFRGSLGAFANYILKHNRVAGLTHGIIRFCGNDQSEGLKVGGHAQLAAMVVAD